MKILKRNYYKIRAQIIHTNPICGTLYWVFIKKSKQNIIPTIVPFNYASNAQKDEPSQKSKHVCVCVMI